MELRCGSRILHGVLEGNVLEVRCRSNRCGHGPAIVVIHQFNLDTGNIKTLRFKDPSTKEDISGTQQYAAIRTT